MSFRRIIKKAGLRSLRIHDLRHTHATLMLTAGVHPKVVSERLGHANISITLGIYSHGLLGMQEAAAEKFDNIFEPDISMKSKSNVGKMIARIMMIPPIVGVPFFSIWPSRDRLIRY